MASKLTQLATQRSGLDLQFFSQGSTNWFKSKIAEIRSPSRVINDLKKETTRYVETFSPGRLYFFSYEPAGAQKLPYYDRFPLVLVLSKEGGNFLGLNFHYLPIKYRVNFLDKLLDFADTNGNEIERMRVSYSILTASRQFKEFRPCIKRYIFNNIRSKILAVKPNEWETAVFLPVQTFKKEMAQTVWEESVKEIRKN